MDNGLAKNHVDGFVEDARGYMWIYGEGSVNRYDGYSTVHYSYDPNDSTSFYGYPYDACVDKAGTLWFLTSSALLKYNEPTDDFTRIVSYKSLEGENIDLREFNNIEVDSDGNLIASKGGKRIVHVDTKTLLSEESSVPVPQEIEEKQGNESKAIFIDKEGVLWYNLANSSYLVMSVKGEPAVLLDYKSLGFGEVGLNKILDDYTGENLILIPNANLSFFFLFNKKERTFRKVRHTWKNTTYVNKFLAGAVSYDENTILVGYVENLGIRSVNLKTGEIKEFKNDINYPNSLSNNNIVSMYRSSDGLIWIGTHYEGVNILDPNLKPFRLYKKQGFDLENSLSYNMVTSYLEGKDGSIWIGTFKGLNKFDPRREKFEHFVHSPTKGSLSSDDVLSLAETEDGTIWVATWNGGLNKFNPKTGKFKTYMMNQDNPESLVCNHVMQVAVSADDKIWVGYNWCGETGIAFSLFDPVTEEFEHFSYSREEGVPLTDGLNVLYADSYNNLWVGAQKGSGLYVFKYEIDKGQFKHFILPKDTYFDSFAVDCFLEEGEGKMWMGTRGGGLLLFDEETETITRYNQYSHGFPSNEVKSIQKDKEGNLWMGTGNGLVRFNPASGDVTSFGVKDGMQSKGFDDGSLYSSTGEMYFGGVKGLNVFRPEEIKSNQNIPPVFITKFNLFNKEVTFKDEGSPLEEDISSLEHLTLTHEQNIFSLELTTLNYTNPEQNRYAYMLEGFEQDWNYIGEKRTATYTNLNAGEYVFKAKAANNDGLWNEEGLSLKITILPPWWETWWFRLIVGGLVIGGAFGFYRYRTFKLKEQKKLLERKVQERTSELQEANDEIQVQNEEMAQQAEELEQQRDYLQEANESISQKNEMITASINYAQRIQQAILPLEEELARQFSDHFVLFRPRDVVSGDFYWMHEGDGVTYIAVVDCTGHGVPGAFMSMIGSSLLNRIVGEMRVTDPKEILAHLHHNIVKALRQETSRNRDGMDMGLCAIYKNKGHQKVVFAGAKSFLFVQYPTAPLEVFESSRMSVGGSKTEKTSFRAEEFSFEEGTVLYLTTDGYIDQHRALDRRRLGRKRLKEQLEVVKGLALLDQKVYLEKYLDEYMGDEPQRDDIAMIGIKL
ncbi:two-component regulator propeller domain-containing protein [Flammeovirgaceae bacterium SG7u.111]|nr:two-component regulator propeller domain-containing protein [Flammeovirgaceae bacterium SG7u.111]